MATKKPEGTINVAEGRDPSGSSAEVSALPPEERHLRIAEAAYLRAAAREFVGGDPLQDWLEAETEVMGHPITK